ncbi:MAG TPA: glycosyltransferase [Flavobacteriales bacterium]|nr:glycosyltransferase [Flavobacteriales bacterium]
MRTPLVSIIIPAYNAAPYIEQTIRSVLDQTFTDFEVIVVDDGSTDSTADIVSRITDPRISLVRQHNGGVSNARNAGIELARGGIIGFLDADDTFEPKAIEVKVKALASVDVGWVFCDLLVCDAELNPVGLINGNADDIVRTILLGIEPAVPGACSNIMLKRTCIANGLRFNPALSNAADQLFVLALANQFKAAHIAEPLVRYRVIPTSMSRNVKLYEADHRRLMRAANEMGLFKEPAFARTCRANAEWSIGGSWWMNGKRPIKGLIHLIRSVLIDPTVLLRRAKRKASRDRAPDPFTP